jgi:hypothetical protein
MLLAKRHFKNTASHLIQCRAGYPSYRIIRAAALVIRSQPSFDAARAGETCIMVETDNTLTCPQPKNRTIKI